MSTKFIEAFDKARQENSAALDDKDLLIIDSAVEINERINKHEGYESSVTLCFIQGTKLHFNFDIKFANMHKTVALTADKGQFRKSKPTFEFSDSFAGLDSKTVDVDSEEGLNTLLEGIAQALGKEKAKMDYKKALERALLRRTLN